MTLTASLITKIFSEVLSFGPRILRFALSLH
jgi:hypothetical protein